MEQVKVVARDRALMMLKASGCKYIVIDSDGGKHIEGDLELAEPKGPKKRSTPSHRPRNALVSYYKPFIENMQVGECVTVPFGPFDNERGPLSAAVSAWCTHYWGHKAAITHQSPSGVEVLRVA
jgi:hypothetical protein